VAVFGKSEIDFKQALRWLHKQWNVRSLLCEGGGEVNGALFKAGFVDELYLTICPVIFGGRDAPTLADGCGFEFLSDASQLALHRMKRVGDELFLVYRTENHGEH
jgi:riboflavin biosynthesis pyrimidine reductase